MGVGSVHLPFAVRFGKLIVKIEYENAVFVDSGCLDNSEISQSERPTRKPQRVLVKASQGF